ncbi:hypothetical protein LguiA_029261 [Lonicera macranthoides]
MNHSSHHHWASPTSLAVSASSNSLYRSNLDAALSSISSNTNTATYGFYNTSVEQNANTANNALALCRGDINPDICGKCFYNSSLKLSELCPNQKEAYGLYDFCMLRYLNRYIYQNREDSLVFTLSNPTNVSNMAQFNDDLRTLMDNLRSRAAAGGPLRKFAAGNISDRAAKGIPGCCGGRRGGRVVRPSCSVHFEVDSFFIVTQDDATPPPAPLQPLSPPPTSIVKTLIVDCKDDNTTRTVIVIVVPIVVFVILHVIGKASKWVRDSSEDVVYELWLLGFCLEGIERLLIYEFVLNASLDHFIFDPVNRADLDWDRYYKIIDEEMNPKIADFGMARLFERYETQGNTSRIVGTYFGVLVLEIISGQRNNCFRNGENVEDLLSYDWKNWQERGGTDLIDPILRSNSSPIRDLMRCVHIGLLCVQENVVDRPTMASIVLMLSSFSLTLPVPSELAFFMHSSVVDPEKPLFGEYNSGASESSEWKNVSAKVPISDASATKLYPR